MLSKPKFKSGKETSEKYVIEKNNNHNKDNHKDTDLQFSNQINLENNEGKVENNNNSYLIKYFI